MKKNTIRLRQSELNDIITETVGRLINEIGDTHQGQYMLGRLAGRKQKNEPEDTRYDEVGKVISHAEKGHDRLSKEVAFNKGAKGYSKERHTNYPEVELERYKKQDEEHHMALISEFRAVCENVSDKKKITDGDVKVMKMFAENLHQFFGNEHSQRLVDLVNEISNRGKASNFDIFALYRALYDLEKSY